MPLRDHFRPPLDSRTSWEGFHGGWPMVIAQRLNSRLPPDYVAEPRVHLGSAFEIDVAAYEQDAAESWSPSEAPGSATAAWSPAHPAVLLEADIPTPSEYEVLVHDVTRRRRLVAAVEIISPANKDRAESRRAFVLKCEALLRRGVCVAIVDLVTIRSANLYRELAELLGAAEPAAVRGPIYAVTCRGRRNGERWRVEAWEHELVLGQSLPNAELSRHAPRCTWEHELVLGQSLPTLPLWLPDGQFVPLELEASYEETCRALRIP